MRSKIYLQSDEDGRIRVTSDAVNMINNTVIETTDYNKLENKPSIEGNELIGDKTLDELGINAESLNVTAESLGITADSLGITAESLGITPESIGMDTADTYSIYSLFHS